MPANRPNLRPSAGGLLLALLLIGVMIPAVSAEAYNETFVETEDIISSYKISQISASDYEHGTLILELYPAESFVNSELKTITYKGTTWPSNNKIFYTGDHASILNSLQSYAWGDVPLKSGSTVVGHADIGFYRYGEDNDHVTWFIWFNEQPDLSGITGLATLTPDFSSYQYNSWTVYTTRPSYVIKPLPEQYAALKATGGSYTRIPGYQLVNENANYAIFWSYWKCRYEVSDNYTVGAESFFDFNLNRNVDGTAYYSHVLIKTKDGASLYNAANTDDIALPMLTERQMPYQLSVKNPATETWFNRTIGFNLDIPVTPTPATATVYVRNSQTGALLANARLTIQDATTDPWTEVVNETLPSGQGSFSLPKDTGIHLTQYRIGATVPGYQQVVPALFARVTGPTNIVVEMEPTAGGPEDPNNTYLEFYVRDIHANGIPNANVLVDGKTRWTNGQGYTQFEVAKNATYPYTVSKSGYMTIQGSAIVADGPRYVANVVLGPGTVPTYTPTIDPGETPGGPGATPTPDTRTNEQKGQAIIDLIADFAEPIALLAIVATVFGLMQMMMPRRR